MSLWGNFLPRGQVGRQGQEHMDTRVAETSRAQLPRGDPSQAPEQGQCKECWDVQD